MSRHQSLDHLAESLAAPLDDRGSRSVSLRERCFLLVARGDDDRQLPRGDLAAQRAYHAGAVETRHGPREAVACDQLIGLFAVVE